ncbi:MAG: hypothetical protein JWM93_1473 [Frankiales bacterium]|nr:hypothetical protein [Frankiales bacterium]
MWGYRPELLAAVGASRHVARGPHARRATDRIRVTVSVGLAVRTSTGLRVRLPLEADHRWGQSGSKYQLGIADVGRGSVVTSDRPLLSGVYFRPRSFHGHRPALVRPHAELRPGEGAHCFT